MNLPDPDLNPFVGTRDDFFAYLRELPARERAEFLETLPPEAQAIAARHFQPAPPPLEREELSLRSPAVPAGGRRFRVRNGTGGHMVYLRSDRGDLEQARSHVIGRAYEIWARNSIRAGGVSAALVDERGRALEPCVDPVTTYRRAAQQ